MSKYIVTCCSTVDLSKEVLDSKGIPFVPFTLNLNGKSIKDDYVSYPIEKFYEDLKNGAEPTTSQVNSDEYTAFFEKYLKEGYDIFHITVSSGISGTINSCRIAAEELNEKYENKVHYLDSLCCSGGYGLLTLMAKDNLDKGMSLLENYKDIEEKRLHLEHWFFSTDLTAYVRGGRISKAAGLIGTALQVCPLMTVSKEGKLEPVEKIRTKSKAMKMALSKMIELADNGLEYDGPVYMNQSDCLEDAETLASMIKETFHNIKEVKIFYVGTVIGAHTGVGTVALYFMGKEREY